MTATDPRRDGARARRGTNPGPLRRAGVGSALLIALAMPVLPAHADTPSARSVRTYTVVGTPVTGGSSIDTAPELTAGQYVDSVKASGQGATEHFYKVRRTIPGSTLWVSAAARMPFAGSDGYRRAGWEYKLVPINDTQTTCRTADYGSGRLGDNDGSVLAAGTVAAFALDPRATKPSDNAKACAEASEFIYTIIRGEGEGGGVDTEIRVIEERPVADAGGLPDGVASVPTSSTARVSPASGTPTRVVGGNSFNDAEKLAPGTYEAEILPGEMVFFATDLGWGQSATFAIDGLPEKYLPAQSVGTVWMDIVGNVYGPDFGQLDSAGISSEARYELRDTGIKLSSSEPDINMLPPIRYRNRWDSPAITDNRGFAIAGSYYYTIQVPLMKETEGIPMPVRFSIGVAGSAEPGPTVHPEAQPTYVPPNASEIHPVTGQTDNRPRFPLVPVVGGSLIGLGTLGGVGYLIWRRRR